jgi:hypothetical protein
VKLSHISDLLLLPCIRKNLPGADSVGDQVFTFRHFFFLRDCGMIGTFADYILNERKKRSSYEYIGFSWRY